MLTGVKVLELTGGSSGAYAGRLFACSGAKVTKAIKRPQSISAFRDEGKRLVYMNDQLPNGEGNCHLLSESWDIILWDSHMNAELDQYFRESHMDKREGGTARIRVDLPEEVDVDEEQALQAMGGWMELTGSPESSPLAIGGYPATYLVGAHAATAGLLALVERGWTKQGGLITIDALSIVVSGLEGAYSNYLANGLSRGRPGNRHHSLAPMAIMPAADGWALVGAPVDEQWELLKSWAELPDVKEWRDASDRKNHCLDLEDYLANWTRHMTCQDLFIDGQTFRMPFAKVQSPEELMDCPQLEHRGFWSDSGSGNEKIQLPWKISSNPVFQRTSLLASSWREIRILDLTSMWSGPYCTRLFADMGTEVIKVEAPHRPDGIRANQVTASPFFRELNRNKQGIQLDLRVESERQELLQLVRESDVLVENFSPRVMRNFGLECETLWDCQPKLGIISLSAFGQTGPYHNFVGYGSTLETMSGIASLTYYPDGVPWLPGFSVSDIGAGIHGAFALASVLLQKQQRGAGFRVDLSQYETACQFVGDYLVDRTVATKPERAVKVNGIADLVNNHQLSQIAIPGGPPVMGVPWKRAGWVTPCNPPPALGEHKMSFASPDGI